MYIKRKVTEREVVWTSKGRVKRMFARVVNIPRYFIGKRLKVKVGDKWVERKVYKSRIGLIYLGKGFHDDYAVIKIDKEMVLDYLKEKLGLVADYEDDGANIEGRQH
ncbi:MAG: hypothetical protein DRI44_05440 [Chlamydiae bacterium]|nr:MAG: hypothetical protein DRI44_05440 [Chlamydiota bacterium]